MATENALALSINPPALDLATPMMRAAQIRHAEAQTNELQATRAREEIGSFARSMAPYIGTPQEDQAWQSGVTRLAQNKVLHPDGAQHMLSLPSQMRAMAVDSALRGSMTAKEAFQQAEANRAQKNADRSFGLEREKLDLAKMAPVDVGVDAFGGTIKATRNPKSGDYERIVVKDAKASPASAGTAPGTSPVAPSPVSAADNETDTKAGRNVQYLGTLDPDMQAIVRRVANNDMDPRTLSIKGGHRERVLAAVAQFDPTYDQKNYASFAAGLKTFQTGKEGASVRAFNVGIEHLDQLLELGRNLNNTSTPKFNELKNWVKTNIGEDAPTNFNGLKAIVGAEIVKAIVGAGGTGEERANAAKTVAAASSPEQLEGIVKTYTKAMGAQLGGLQRQYEQSTGRKDFDRLLSPQAKRARESHDNPTSNAPATMPARVRQNGHTYERQPDGSYQAID